MIQDVMRFSLSLLIPNTESTIIKGDMTTLLQQAIAEIEKLPAEGQDAIATRIMAELADEQAWATRFGATNDEQWERLVQLARRQIASGETTPLDEVFPPGILQP